MFPEFPPFHLHELTSNLNILDLLSHLSPIFNYHKPLPRKKKYFLNKKKARQKIKIHGRAINSPFDGRGRRVRASEIALHVCQIRLESITVPGACACDLKLFLN